MSTLPIGRERMALERLVAEILQAHERTTSELVVALTARYEAALATIVPALLSGSRRFRSNGGKWSIVQTVSRASARPTTTDAMNRERERRRRKRERRRLQ